MLLKHGQRGGQRTPEVTSRRRTQGLAHAPPSVCLACPEHTSPPTALQQHSLLCLPAPSQPCLCLLPILPPSPRSPQHEHGIDGSGHLLLLPSTVLYPPLMPCPHLSGKQPPSLLLVLAVLMNHLLQDQHMIRLEPNRAFLALVPGAWSKSGCSEPACSFLGLWIK